MFTNSNTIHERINESSAIDKKSTNELYKMLEMRKILQIHHKIPTTFVIPTGNLEFSGISFVGSEEMRKVEFQLKKENMEETWKIKETSKNMENKLTDGIDFEDTKTKNIADVLLSKYQISFK